MATEKQNERKAPPTGRNAGSTASQVVETLITSSPAWIRGTVLLLLGGALIILVVTVCAAIFAGREVSIWPPRVQAYIPPQVQNCTALLAALPDIRKSEEDEIGRLGATTSNLFDEIKKLARDYTLTGANTVYINSAMGDLRRDIEALSKRMDDALLKLRKRNDDVVTGCLNVSKS
jgi:hypothetical protein